MTSKPERKVISNSWSEILYPPGDFYSDEPPWETYLHCQQLILLLTCLEWLWQDRNDYFASGNLTIYYSGEETKSEKYSGPDFFVVLDAIQRLRKSWVVWLEEYKYPNLIVELLSPSTAKIDREDKKELYQNRFRTPNYFWFDPYSLEFQGFHLVDGIYQPIEPNQQGWLWSDQLNLYLGIYEKKLRYFSPEGELIPTHQEAEIQERQQKEYERQQKEYERQQKELALQQREHERQQKEYERQQKELALQQKELALQRLEELTARLRELGIDLDSET